MDKDKPEYKIGVQPTAAGEWCVIVIFEPCATQDAALELAHTVAPLIHEAVGGSQSRIQ